MSLYDERKSTYARGWRADGKKRCRTVHRREPARYKRDLLDQRNSPRKANRERDRKFAGRGLVSEKRSLVPISLLGKEILLQIKSWRS